MKRKIPAETENVRSCMRHGCQVVINVGCGVDQFGCGVDQLGCGVDQLGCGVAQSKSAA